MSLPACPEPCPLVSRLAAVPLNRESPQPGLPSSSGSRLWSSSLVRRFVGVVLNTLGGSGMGGMGRGGGMGMMGGGMG
eukprot:SAG22_NODE_7631_length_722_cov_1.000000_1_plen_77_part_01